jgi:hypothetical protein
MRLHAFYRVFRRKPAWTKAFSSEVEPGSHEENASNTGPGRNRFRGEIGGRKTKKRLRRIDASVFRERERPDY